MVPGMMQIAFKDKMVTYETFVNDVAARVVSMLREETNDPIMISQRKAYKMFGRANVERWLRGDKVYVTRCLGKLEYRTAELRLLQRTEETPANTRIITYQPHKK